jgi:hypothetical protein
MSGACIWNANQMVGLDIDSGPRRYVDMHLRE